MAISDERVRQIAAQVSAYVDAQRATPLPSRPRLIVPEHVRPPSLLTDTARAAHLRWIHAITFRYSLGWLVDQELRKKCSIDEATDEQVVAVEALLQRALRCIAEGVSYDDAGLVDWAC